VSNQDVAMLEPKRRGLWFKLLIGFCIVVLIVAGWLFLERIRGQATLRKYERELIAKGEKLTFAEIVSKTDDIKSLDRAIELIAACSRLQTGAVLIANAPPANKTIASNKVLVITRESTWPGAKNRLLTWEQAREDLERNRQVLNEMRALACSPKLSYPINYRGVRTMLPHLTAIKKAGQWFSASSLCHLREGEVERAIDDIETILLLARVLEDEPIIISQFVRIAVVAIAIENCWQLLQCDTIKDVQLARLHGLFAKLDFAPGMIRALQAQRAMGRDSVQSMRTGELSFDFVKGIGGLFPLDDELPQALEKMPYGEELQEGIREVLLYPMWRFVFSYDDERHLLAEIQTLIDAMRESGTSRSTAKLQITSQKVDRKLQRESRSWQRIGTSLSLLPIASSSAMSSFRAATHCQIATTAIALKRCHLRYQKYPATLAELVPEFLSEVPIDYLDGAPLRYRVEESGSFVLWSVGNNGKDDGGSPSERRSYWLSVTNDAVWPQPASEAEVTASRESQPKR
jgi:hypothetical protein